MYIGKVGLASGKELYRFMDSCFHMLDMGTFIMNRTCAEKWCEVTSYDMYMVQMAF